MYPANLNEKQNTSIINQQNNYNSIPSILVTEFTLKLNKLQMELYFSEHSCVRSQGKNGVEIVLCLKLL